jgi:threonine dehydratase
MLHKILKARVLDVAIESPLDAARRLSERLGVRVLFKREDLQPGFSFKLRGAYNKLVQLPLADIEAGVVCASAGNHAQGVALAARMRGVPAIIVMPESTPRIKTEAVESLGGEVVLTGLNYDAAFEHASQLATDRGLVLIHPFDDLDVIAGQGTIGMEIHNQTGGDVEAIFVPIGGGGLIAGIASYIKAVAPEIKVIGVEPEDAASMSAALEAGRPVLLDEVGLFADGVAVRRVGVETFKICSELVDDVVLVSNDEICAAVQDIFEDTRAIVEPAGALAVAGLKAWVSKRKRLKEEGQAGGPADDLRGPLVAVNSGANVNFDRLRHIAERAALGEQREALYSVEIPEQRGSFLRFCTALGKRNVTEFNYRYRSESVANIFVGVELQRGSAEREQIASALVSAGYPVLDMSDNETAKGHIRHMVGGHNPGLSSERVYRLRFPERKGALLDFLHAIGQRWSITMFHYRNHGADYGRVLVGVQVPESELESFNSHLLQLGYPYTEETENPAYREFLS